MTDQQAGLIVTDPDVVGGQARVRGTRIPVSVILDCLAAGLSEEEILQQYPTLTVEGVRAAAAYGAALAREEIHPLLARNSSSTRTCLTNWPWRFVARAMTSTRSLTSSSPARVTR